MSLIKRGRGFIVSTAAVAAAAVVYTACMCVFGLEKQLYAFSAPFVLVGKGLRALSLSGAAGNAAAMVLYAALCSIPALLAVLAFFRDRRLTVSKLLLLLLSGYSFAMMYFFVNPNAVRFSVEPSSEVRQQFLSVLFLGMAFAFYALLLLCVAVKLVGGARRDEAAFYRSVRLLCVLAGCAVAFAFFGFELSAFVASVQRGAADAAVGAVTLLLHGALYALLFTAALSVYGGTEELRADLYSPKNVALLKNVSRLCLADFLGGIAVCAFLNLLNFSLTPVLHNAAFEFTVSVSVAAIAAVCLFACKLLLRAIDLNEENQLTI